MKTTTDAAGKVYKVTESGTCYSEETPDELINVLDRIGREQRVKLCYGDQKTGENWHEEMDIIGRIGRSTGRIKIPLLLATNRSWGGLAIHTDCILKITETQTKVVLYQHPLYRQPEINIVPSDLPPYMYNTIVDGELHGRHRSLKSAQICKSKLL